MSELALLFRSDRFWCGFGGLTMCCYCVWSLDRADKGEGECLVCGALGRKSRMLYVLYICALPGLATSV